MIAPAIIVALLGLAAWRDVATRSIPDSISVAIIALGVVSRLLEGWDSAGASLAVALLLFVCLLPLQARGLLGGADLKLVCALAFGLPPLATWRLVLIVALSGAVLAAIYLALRLLVGRVRPAPAAAGRGHSLARRVATVEAWRIRKGAPLPYGLAIAAGTAFTFAHGGV